MNRSERDGGGDGRLIPNRALCYKCRLSLCLSVVLFSLPPPLCLFSGRSPLNKGRKYGDIFVRLSLSLFRLGAGPGERHLTRFVRAGK